MLELPPTPPTVGWSAAVRLGRDHYVRLDANDYSVHPSVVGRKVTVSADLNIDGILVIVTPQAMTDPTAIERLPDARTTGAGAADAKGEKPESGAPASTGSPATATPAAPAAGKPAPASAAAASTPAAQDQTSTSAKKKKEKKPKAKKDTKTSTDTSTKPVPQNQ